MPPATPRALTQRWHLGTLPPTWDRAFRFLGERLRALQETLRVVHAAVEHPAPTLLPRQMCTVDTAITATTDTAVTGATITFTPDVDMRAEVTGVFDASCSAFTSNAHILIGSLYVNGAAQTGVFRANAAAVSDIRNGSQKWTITLSAGTEYTFALYGRTNNAATTWSIRAAHTAIVIAKFPNLYKAT